MPVFILGLFKMCESRFAICFQRVVFVNRNLLIVSENKTWPYELILINGLNYQDYVAA